MSGVNLGSLSGTAQQAFAQLPPDLQQSLLNAIPPQTADAGPAVDLASKVASGGVPSEAEIVAGLGGIATLAGGPLIGGAMTAIGGMTIVFEDALKALFSAFGFYKPPPPEFAYHGLQRIGIDQVPFSKQDATNWIHFDRIEDYGQVNGMNWRGLEMPGGRPPYNPDAATASDPWQTTAVSLLFSCLYSLMSPADRWRWDNGSWKGGAWYPSTANPPSGMTPFGEVNALNAPQYRPITAFETYFIRLLLEDLVWWANAWPYIPPHDLLRSAVAVWNSQHSSSTVQTYSPHEGQGVPYKNNDIIEWVLSGWADSTDSMYSMAPITVNAGPKTVALHIHLGGLLGPSKGKAVSTVSLPIVGAVKSIASQAAAGGLTIPQYIALQNAQSQAAAPSEQIGGALHPAGSSSSSSSTLFTVAGHAVTKQQATVAGVVAAAIAAFKFL